MADERAATELWLNGSATAMAVLSARSAAAFGALFSALTLVGVCGNSLVILAIATDGRMRQSAMNVILCNLAVADLLNLLACSAEWLQTIALLGPGWLLPARLCPALRFAEVVFLYASLLSQLTVCVERFIVIVYPLKALAVCSRRYAVGSICCLWTFALAFATPYSFYHATVRGKCVWTIMPHFMLYKLSECLVFYFGPLAVSIALYANVSKVLWSKDKRLEDSTNDRDGAILRTRRNVVKMLAACVAVYFVCYSPIQAIFVSRALLGRRLQPDAQVTLLLNALAVACSAANPLLYTLFSQRCRARFAQLLGCADAAATRAACRPPTPGSIGAASIELLERPRWSRRRLPAAESFDASTTPFATICSIDAL